MALVKAQLNHIRSGMSVCVVQRFVDKADVAHIGHVVAADRTALVFTDGRQINLKLHPGMTSTVIYLVKNKA